MVRRCFFRCEGTSPLYALPKPEPSRSHWLEFIFNPIFNPIPPTVPNLFLCRHHFTEGCFKNLRSFTSGFAKLLTLRIDAVPTLCGPMGEDVSQHQDCSAYYRPFQHVGCQTDSPPIISAGTQTITSVGIQTARFKSTSVGTQFSMGSLKTRVRTKAMQTQVSPLSVDLGTTSHLPDSPLTSTSIKGQGWRPSKRPRLELEEEEESDSSIESHKEPLDSTYNSGDSVLTEESDVSFETRLKQNEAKYIVFESCLKQLFENCPACQGGCDLQQRRIGTYVAFTQRCLHCSYFRQWESQPMVLNTPIADLQLLAATDFTGSSFTHLQKWKMDQQHHFQEQLRLRGSVAVGDEMRADSQEDCDDFVDHSTQTLHVDAPGSSHMSSHNGELRILSVHGKGEGPLAVDGHDTLVTASEVEALSSPSADHSAAKSLERGELLVRHEELSVQQQTPDTIVIKVEEDIDGGMPTVEDYNDFVEHSTQTLHVDAPGSSHMSSHNGELRILSVYGKGEGPLAVDGHDTLVTASEVEALSSPSADHSAAKSLERGELLVRHEELSVQQTPDTILIKVEEDIGGGMPTVEDCDDFGDRSTQRGTTSENLHVDAPGSSRMSSHNGELRILSVDGKGEGPLAVDGHDTLLTASGKEALSSPSADHSAAKSLDRGEPLGHPEDLIGAQGGPKLRPRVLSGEGFPDNTKMTIHMVTHTSKKPYVCDQCMKHFSTSYNLKKHMRTHSGEKPYSCDQCMTRFGTSYNLKKHMRTHSGEKPYSCDQCMTRFGTSYNLRIHMKTHSGEKPYSCDQCMKRFIQNSSLKMHMRTHSAERAYRCDQCMRRFSTSYSLQFHMRTHSGEKPYRCDQCMKHFRQNSVLKDHMRTHSGEKPFGCAQCMKRFGRSSTLKIHMKTHSGEKPCVSAVQRQLQRH
ncbi:zinc finger protein 184-like isoform X2 [Gadus chalcogrammus]|uniref:zinc finger protein 184-like isoform X2 n=1 Tax=Gadus chalcogrammus TaxID=1042646 RepID=UPI0024C4C4C8|nr:zinc finger protein 184-like isoform X2 [Gadus chalcogrammus]